jgi:hypothetical protein
MTRRLKLPSPPGTPEKPEVVAERRKLDTNQIKPGQLMAFVHWAKVDSVNAGGADVYLTNVDNGEGFRVRGLPIVQEAYSADVVTSEEKVSKTRAAELLISSSGKPFTVIFDKSSGETRTLRGRLVKSEPLLGRSMVEDLDLDKDVYRLRQVDHRTIHSLVLDSVKYTVKNG